MTRADERLFSVEDAVATQRALREAVGLNPELFDVPAFVGMISDEIDRWREAGRTDQAIADAIEHATGKRIEAGEIGRFYAEPERRARPA